MLGEERTIDCNILRRRKEDEGNEDSRNESDLDHILRSAPNETLTYGFKPALDLSSHNPQGQSNYTLNRHNP